MKLSIIIPVYNGNETIIRALDSVKNQKTKHDYEVFIVNDCSTDNTKDIVVDYISELDNYFFIDNKKNLGVNKSRNKAIHASNGEYIAFLDADDSWLPTKIEEQINILDSNKKVALCFSDFSIFNDKNEFICNNFEYWKFFKKMIKKDSDYQICRNIFSVVLKENIIGTSSVMVRKDELMRTTLFHSDLPYSQDWDLWLKLALNNSFAFSNKPLMNYYMLGGSITRKSKTKHELISIVKKYKKNCTLKTYLIAKSNCYAFIGQTAFQSSNYKFAHKYYIKSMSSFFQINHFKEYLSHTFKSIKN